MHRRNDAASEPSAVEKTRASVATFFVITHASSGVVFSRCVEAHLHALVNGAF
jgi:hypothetical protein